ncbi:MAG: hypothetical protein SchgKO_10620 [Schleiferiaceae bacterium]
MKTLSTLFIAFAFLSACSAPDIIPSDSMPVLENQIAEDARTLSDTVLTFSKWDRGELSNYVRTIFIDKDGQTKCFMNSVTHRYTDTTTIEDFNWKRFFNAKDSVYSQKPMPFYKGKVMEGDTLWVEIEPRSTLYYTVNIYVRDATNHWETITWETNGFYVESNPSMASSKLIKYLHKKTNSYYKSGKGEYGKRRKQRKYTIED